MDSEMDGMDWSLPYLGTTGTTQLDASGAEAGGFYLQSLLQTPVPIGHICGYCNKIYQRKGELTRHGKTHTQIPGFVCPVQGCNRGWFLNGFHRKDKLVDHMVAGHKLGRDVVKENIVDWMFNDLMGTKVILPLVPGNGSGVAA